jgi:Leucine-rich repeat (LRR) protein
MHFNVYFNVYFNFFFFFFKSNLEFLKLKAEKIEPGAFNGLSKLAHLDLSSSGSLERVRASLFANLSALRVLNLSSCSIQAIEVNALDELSNLEYLDISSNELVEFETNCEPRFVNASFNKKLTSVVFHGRGPLSRMEEADFSWDKLPMASFNSIFSGQEVSLKRLDLSWNQISELGEGAFSAMKSLKMLIINGNCVNEISTEAFEGLASLEQLNLSLRSLKCLKPGVFRHFANLKIMELLKNTQSSLLTFIYFITFQQNFTPT